MNMSVKAKNNQISSYTETLKQGVSLGRKNYIYLTIVMAITDFKIKYDNSVLGYLWSLLKPLLMFGTLYLVFSVFVRWDVENYKLYLLLGIILWNFLGEVTLNSMVLLEGKAPILKKIYFPRWIIVIASSLTSLLTLMLNMVVFFIFFIISGTQFSIGIFMLALYLLELYLLVVGMALLLCALFPKFRDIHHIWEVFVQLGFWVTPIVYPIAIVPAKYHPLIFLNPAARIIQGCRQAIIGPAGEFMAFKSHIIIIFIAVFFFVIGLGLFNKLSRSFAEDL
jgi:ABC-type polysaccharide/polyol phosphate export permease